MTLPPVPVLFTDHAPALGGAEQFLLQLCRRLDPLCWQPHLACAEGKLAEASRWQGIAAHPMPWPRIRNAPVNLILTGIRLARLVRQINAPVIYAFTVRTVYPAALAARLTGVPLIWHMQDFWLSEDRPAHESLDRALKQIAGAAAFRIVAVSRAVAGCLPRPAKIRIVPDGIDPSPFQELPDPGPFRERYQIPPGTPVAGMIGRLRPWKGPARFLRIVRRVQAHIPDARFLLVGGDPFTVNDGFASELKQLARTGKPEDAPVFTGHLDDIRPALQVMDVFVHPGDPEPFGLVNLEAMAAGKPVVAFAHGALPEIVQPGETGLLVKPCDEDAMASAITGLLRDPARGRRLGQAGRKRVTEEFHIARTADAISQILKEALACFGSVSSRGSFR